MSTEKQVWEQNGIKFINEKGSSTNNVADYVNPVRIYPNSKIIIEGAGMTKIGIDCNTASYANVIKNSIGTPNGLTVIINSDKVTITFNEAVNSFEIEKVTAQTRFDSITVNN